MLLNLSNITAKAFQSKIKMLIQIKRTFPKKIDTVLEENQNLVIMEAEKLSVSTKTKAISIACIPIIYREKIRRGIYKEIN